MKHYSFHALYRSLLEDRYKVLYGSLVNDQNTMLLYEQDHYNTSYIKGIV